LRLRAASSFPWAVAWILCFGGTVAATEDFAPDIGIGNIRYSSRGLPQWCLFTQDGNYHVPEKDHYSAVFGSENFHHMHHYCRALARLQSGIGETEDHQLRDGHFYAVVREIDYVLRNTMGTYHLTNASKRLRSEMYHVRGTALLALGDNVGASEAFSNAISVNPDYLPPYVSLAKYFLSVDDAEGARQVLELGLAHVPDPAPLREMLEDLGAAR
jgi:hypothetical protein